MRIRALLSSMAVAAVTVVVMSSPQAAAGLQLSPKEALGRKLFFDQNLSEPKGQACASCHDPSHAFSDPRGGATSEGVIPGLFGPRNAPSAMYNILTPPLLPGGDGGKKGFSGGFFRDGRVDFIEDQAKQPFLNPIEMANPDAAAVVAKVKVAKYAADFVAVYGGGVFNDTDTAYNAVADALGAFERSKTFQPFSSKFDAYQRGEATLTDAEMRGLAAFTAADKGNCAACHSPTSVEKGGRKSVFTDFGYDNIGVPPNPDNKFYGIPAQFNPDGKQFVDIGLGKVVLQDFTRGQFKAPTLRNIAITGPYMHNGYFKTLKGVVDFYNTRDVRPVCAKRFTTEAKALRLGCWPAAEVAETVNKDDMGNLGLTAQEVDDIVAYLGTLTDGWTPPAARAGKAGATRPR